MRLRYIFWISIIICQSFILWTLIAQRPISKTFTIVNMGDNPREIVYIDKISFWGPQYNRAVEINTGTYSRTVLLGDEINWNKIFGEHFITKTLKPRESATTTYTIRSNPDVQVIVGPLWILKDKLYSYKDFIELLGYLAKYNSVRLEAKLHEFGFYRIVGE